MRYRTMVPKFVALALSAAALTAVVGCSADNDLPSLMAQKPGLADTSANAPHEVAPEATEDAVFAADQSTSREQALKAAQDLLNTARETGISRRELYKMLRHHDWFSHEDAAYALENLSVNWNTQAVRTAKWWTGLMGDGVLTRTDLIDYLTMAGYTTSQASYAADAVTDRLASSTATRSASDSTTPPAVTPTSPATTPSEPSANPTVGTY